jgi:hypothetical protein
MPASSSSPSSPPPSRSSFLHDLVKQWTTIPGRKRSNAGSNSKDSLELPGAPAEEQQQEQRTVRLPDPTPTTPVGLKPRRSIASLKKSLDVVVAKGEDDDEGSWGVAPYHHHPQHHHPAAAATTMISSPVVSSRSLYGSASAATFASMGQSPSGNSTTATKSQQVAASPVLLPGRARTAVGALVAEAAVATAATSEHRREDSASTRSPLRGGVSTSAAETTTMYGSANLLLNQSLQSILPPFDDVDNYQYSGRSRRYGSHTHNRSEQMLSPGPPQPLFGAEGHDNDVALFRSVSSPDVVEAFRSPLKGGEAPKPRRLVSHPNMDVNPSGAPSPVVPRPPIESVSPVRRIGRHRNDKTSVVDNPPPSLSPMPSIVASPSSLAGAMHRPMPSQKMDAESRDDYRDVDEFILDGDDSPESFHSREYDDVGRDTNFNPTERTFQKQKFSNQRQAHDDLILAALERLQDEHGLVAEIQKQLGQHDNESSSSATTESFLSGMSTETAQRISCTLVQILQELDVTEQLLFSSPSDAAAVAVPRNDFRDAIRFCLQLVRLSTSGSAAAGSAGGTRSSSEYLQEMSKWRLLPEIKASLGLIPESPRVVPRGGDTSVFSVPCDDSVATPMTSNVSISTTITTRTHLTANNNNPLSPGRHDPPPRFHHQALEVRHTIATIAALLDRTSRLLTKGDKLPTQEIKRVYLEMQTLDISALKCVVESFEIDQPESLLVLLSGSASQDDSLFDVPPPMTTNPTTTATMVAPPPLVESVAQRQMPPDKFFSPILRSQSGNRPGEDTVSNTLAPKGTAQQGEAKPRAAGRRGGVGSRRGNPFRRSTFKLQDPLNLA